jgi:hypothetical protein
MRDVLEGEGVAAWGDESERLLYSCRLFVGDDDHISGEDVEERGWGYDLYRSCFVNEHSSISVD